MIKSRKILAVFSFRRISGQIAVLVVASLLSIHLLVAAVVVFHHHEDMRRPRGRDEDLGLLAELISASPAEERAGLVAAIRSVAPLLDVELTTAHDVVASMAGAPDPGGPPPRAGGFPLHLAPGLVPFPVPGTHRIGVRLADGTVLTARLMPPPSPPFFGNPWLMTFMPVIVSITLLGIWAARTLSRPLSAFAVAAEEFSLNSVAAPLPEKGPDEIRSAARALNRMRERITSLIMDRTRMLAAISHDLRTPITRLRMHLEFVEDETQRGQMLRDLNQMRGMLDSVLSFLRDDHAREAMTLVDLTAIARLVCDEFTDLGHDVSYAGSERVTARARPDELRRAITNLVENAVRYGTSVVVRLLATETTITIDIEDDGPGIENARKARVLEPFDRGDEARTLNDRAGFGLGLSIARSIAMSHGGTLSLHDRSPRGLTVRIELPRRGAAAPDAPLAQLAV